MTNESMGTADPLSRVGVANAVSAARSGWKLVAAEPIDAGIDVLYRVTVATGDGEDERDAVLKCLRPTGPFSDRSDAEFLKEVRLLEAVGTETEIPVPEVYGVCESHPDLPSPLYLMEAVDGVNAETIPVREERGAGERIARESGRYLARIHDLRGFEEYGFLVATDRGVAVTDPRDSWTAFLRDRVEDYLDELPHTRFDDLTESLDTVFDAELDAFGPDPEPVLAHNDYRHGNLHVDPETGDIEAVLDWGAARAGSRLFELVRVEFDLSNHEPGGSPLQERIREALFDAYEEEHGVEFDRDATFERRRRLYRSLLLLKEMRWFDDWYDEMPEHLKSERAGMIREELSALLDVDRTA